MSARDIGHKERILLERGQERLRYAVDLARSGVSSSYVSKVYSSGVSDILAVRQANNMVMNSERAGVIRDSEMIERSMSVAASELRRMGISV